MKTNFVQGSILLHDYGVETKSQDPKINYVPWIIINGEFSQEKNILDFDTYLFPFWGGILLRFQVII